ncbi:MAG TPA: hypothetical protein VM029_03500 [Opitutaceae bacterium]|nr:hypothetical protein [Opitutaceae bacterium]
MPVVHSRWLALITGLVALLLLVTAASWNAVPFLPGSILLEVTFPKGVPNRTDPIVCTGRFGAADFLNVIYRGDNTATVQYDSWGVGGPTSAPFTFVPGKPHALQIEMPSLADTRGARGDALRPLRVTLDGKEVLSAMVRFHARRAHEIYFAGNPIGGNTAGLLFSGTIVAENGHFLRGGPHGLFSWSDRVAFWARTHPWQVLLVLLGSLAAACAVRPLVRWCTSKPLAALPPMTFVARGKSTHAWFAASAAICVVAFGALVTGGTSRFVFEESFGQFYDYQAASLLRGRLDVPADALAGERFEVNGKIYGYFGVTPALLRLPLAAGGIAFGKVSRAYLLGYYTGCLVAAYLLLLQATRMLCGRGARPSGWAVVVLTLSAGLGSSLFFLGARAYIYHEAILCGALFALWTTWCALRYLEAPATRWWLGALACGTLAVHARPPSGLFALCVVGCVALGHLWRAQKMQPSRRWHWRRRHGMVAVFAALAVLSFNGMSYLKFGTFDGSPLRYSVQYTPERVAKFEGKNFHLTNLHRNLDTYVLQPDFSLRPVFPFFFIETINFRTYADARMDLEEPTLALPYAMPALFILALAGCGRAWLWAPRLRRPIAVVALGVLPMTLALFAAVVTSHRYTGDFCPFLIVCAALGLAVVDAESSRWRAGFQAIVTLLAVTGIAITFAIALYFQGEAVWGVPDKERQNYEQLQRRVNAILGLPTRKRGT